MRQLTSIVAVNQDGVIGCRNSLPWRVRSDLRFFRETTSDNVVIMGRKTHDSLGKCLPNRYNIVLSNQLSLFEDKPECVLRYSVSEALAEAELSSSKYGEVFVIGGATMYSQFELFVDRYLITIVDKPVAEADAYFDLSVMENRADWSIEQIMPIQQGEGDEAPFQVFELRSRHSAERQKLRQAAFEEFSAKLPARRKRASLLRSNFAEAQASLAL